MIGSKHLISGLVASAFVTVVGLAYAQTSSTPPTTETAQPQSNTTSDMDPNRTTPSTPSATGGTTGSNASPSTTSATDPVPQADRN